MPKISSVQRTIPLPMRTSLLVECPLPSFPQSLGMAGKIFLKRSFHQETTRRATPPHPLLLEEERQIASLRCPPPLLLAQRKGKQIVLPCWREILSKTTIPSASLVKIATRNFGKT